MLVSVVRGVNFLSDSPLTRLPWSWSFGETPSVPGDSRGGFFRSWKRGSPPVRMAWSWPFGEAPPVPGDSGGGGGGGRGLFRSRKRGSVPVTAQMLPLHRVSPRSCLRALCALGAFVVPVAAGFLRNARAFKKDAGHWGLRHPEQSRFCFPRPLRKNHLANEDMR